MFNTQNRTPMVYLDATFEKLENYRKGKEAVVIFNATPRDESLFNQYIVWKVHMFAILKDLKPLL